MTINHKSSDPLHGITLENILKILVEKYGWDELSIRINIRCFYNEPSIKSSLKFLRRTPWARAKVEKLYIESLPLDDSGSKEKSSRNPWNQ
jgi:uncharacterized protein (DUF2132 family)